MKTIPDFAVSSQEAGFDKFLKVLNECNGTRWKGHRMFYGIVDNCAWTSNKKWGKELSPSEAIALLTGNQLTEGDLIVGNRFECIDSIHNGKINFMKGVIYTCMIEGTITGENNVIVDFPSDEFAERFINRHFKLLPTQESVKQDNAKEFLKNKKITRATCYTDNGTTFYLNDITVLMDEYSTQQTAHLQQQLKEAKELLDTTDDLLTRLEDYTHGKDGESITELRALINKFLTRNK